MSTKPTMSTTPTIPTRSRLLFVYNADSGLLNALSDSLHKLAKPESYPCNLCGLTYGTLGMRRQWRAFIEGLELPVEFLHRDEFIRQFGAVAAGAAGSKAMAEPGAEAAEAGAAGSRGGAVAEAGADEKVRGEPELPAAFLAGEGGHRLLIAAREFNECESLVELKNLVYLKLVAEGLAKAGGREGV